MDTAMGAYLQHHYDAAEADEQQLFAELLQEQDPKDPPNPYRWRLSHHVYGSRFS